jgi:hypothetical protein
VVLPAVVYVFQIWPLALMEEHRLRVFEKRMVRRIFRRKEEKVRRDRRKLRNEELHNLYSPLLLG